MSYAEKQFLFEGLLSITPLSPFVSRCTSTHKSTEISKSGLTSIPVCENVDIRSCFLPVLKTSTCWCRCNFHNLANHRCWPSFPCSPFYSRCRWHRRLVHSRCSSKHSGSRSQAPSQYLYLSLIAGSLHSRRNCGNNRYVLNMKTTCKSSDLQRL